jgi:hypothetical protein
MILLLAKTDVLRGPVPYDGSNELLIATGGYQNRKWQSPTSCLPYLALPPYLLAAAAFGGVDSNGIRFGRLERQPRCPKHLQARFLVSHIDINIKLVKCRLIRRGPICVLCCCVSGESLPMSMPA